MALLALGKEDTAVGRFHFQESKLGADLEACLSEQISRTSTIKSEFSHQVGRAPANGHTPDSDHRYGLTSANFQLTDFITE